ncbi:MAG: insulinase family protein [Kofleriaceae bacterium]|nr:insulinase family protein [Myxococcales bacterium]MCB9561120.1 insulinase family protein [Kofleriaceae bacterium]MCB9571318.1 insulinase family protein [Kofleriaceae bacterium]
MAPLALAAGLVAAGRVATTRPAWAGEAVTATTTAASQDPKIPFEKYTLDNGLEVILIKDQSVPLVAVDVWYHVGSGLETPGKTGFAHLFEHMLFQGSKHVGEDRHFDVLKQVGASAVNGSTNSNRTNYFEVVPSNQLETALWLESDRMGFLLPMLTQKSLDNQIDVVRNERRQRIDNVPYGKSMMTLAEMMYPEGHPYRYSVIGKHEDLQNATLDDVVGFYKTWYVPANATLTVAGDFDDATIKQLVTKWFGDFPVSKKPDVVDIQTPLPDAKRQVVTDDFAQLRQVTWSWVTPRTMAPGDAELDIIADVLAGSEASRLYRSLVIDKRLAQGVSAHQTSLQFSSTFEVTVTLQSDADLAAVEKIMGDAIERLRKEAISDRELSRAVTTFEAQSIRGLQSLLGRAERLQNYNQVLGNPDSITTDLDRYRNATVDGVKATAAEWLAPTHRVELVTMPAGGAK